MFGSLPHFGRRKKGEFANLGVAKYGSQPNTPFDGKIGMLTINLHQDGGQTNHHGRPLEPRGSTVFLV